MARDWIMRLIILSGLAFGIFQLGSVWVEIAAALAQKGDSYE
jgi:hypothetical protein